jgi:hypothetical protein
MIGINIASVFDRIAQWWWSIWGDCFDNVPIEFGPILMWEGFIVNVSIRWIKNQPSVWAYLEVQVYPEDCSKMPFSG